MSRIVALLEAMNLEGGHSSRGYLPEALQHSRVQQKLDVVLREATPWIAAVSYTHLTLPTICSV
eukprot:5527113-Prorocentrum_lima.AAC.1